MPPARRRLPVAHEDPDSVVSVVREREALEELLKTDGWRTFVSHATKEFRGIGFVHRMKTALKTADPGFEARVVDRVADEVLRLLAWPESQVNELKGQVEE